MGNAQAKPNPDAVDLSHFQIEKVVGEGGFGKVLVVSSKTDGGGGIETGKLYAMKAMSKKVAVRRRMTAEFYTERAMLALVQHVFLCNLTCCFQDQHFCFIIMDLCLGGDLRYLVKNTEPHLHLRQSQTQFYVAQAILALEYLHDRNVLHRDIKPANIVMEADGYIKLTDFGIAAELGADGQCRDSSGTQGYKAPEMYCASHRHSFPADIFALGCTMAYLVTGVAPFNVNDNPPTLWPAGQDVLAAVQYPPYHVHRPSVLYDQTHGTDDETGGLAPPLLGLMEQMCAFDPADRAQTAAELRSHPWFDGLDWEALVAKQITPLFMPDAEKPNFDLSMDLESMLDGIEPLKPPSGDPISEEEQQMFRGYEWNTEVVQIQDVSRSSAGLARGTGGGDSKATPKTASRGGSWGSMLTRRRSSKAAKSAASSENGEGSEKGGETGGETGGEMASVLDSVAAMDPESMMLWARSADIGEFEALTRELRDKKEVWLLENMRLTMAEVAKHDLQGQLKATRDTLAEALAKVARYEAGGTIGIGEGSGNEGRGGGAGGVVGDVGDAGGVCVGTDGEGKDGRDKAEGAEGGHGEDAGSGECGEGGGETAEEAMRRWVEGNEEEADVDTGGVGVEARRAKEVTDDGEKHARGPPKAAVVVRVAEQEGNGCRGNAEGEGRVEGGRGDDSDSREKNIPVSVLERAERELESSADFRSSLQPRREWGIDTLHIVSGGDGGEGGGEGGGGDGSRRNVL